MKIWAVFLSLVMALGGLLVKLGRIGETVERSVQQKECIANRADCREKMADRIEKVMRPIHETLNENGERLARIEALLNGGKK